MRIFSVAQGSMGALEYCASILLMPDMHQYKASKYEHASFCPAEESSE